MRSNRLTTPLAKGLDVGSEPQLSQGLLMARNAVIRRNGAVGKRNGWEAAAEPDAGAFDEYPILGALKDTPVIIGDDVQVGLGSVAQSTLSASFQQPSETAKLHAGLADVAPQHFVSGTGDNPEFIDVAGSEALGFFVVAMTFDGTSYVYVLDAETGALIDNRMVWNGTGALFDCAYVRLLSTENTIWYLYVHPNTGAIEGGKVDVTAGVSAIPAASVIYNTQVADTNFLAMDCCCVTEDTAAIAFYQSAAAGLRALIFDADGGTVTHNALWAQTGNKAHVAVIPYSTSAFALVLLATNGAANLILDARGYSTILGAQWTLTGIDTDATFTTGYDVTGIADSTTSLTLYYTVGRQLSGGAAAGEFDWQRRHIKTITIADSGGWGAGSPSVQLYNCALAAKPFADPYTSTTHALAVTYLAAAGADPAGGAGTAYTGVSARSQVGSTFIVRLTSGNRAIGKLAVNRTYVPTEEKPSSAAVSWVDWADAVSVNATHVGRLAHVLTEGDKRFLPVAVLGSYDTYRKKETTSMGKPVWFDLMGAGRGAGAYLAQIDYDVSNVQTLEGRDWLLVPNGNPYEFDGQGIVEQGFPWYPEDVKVTVNGSGSITGEISFAVVAHWEDDEGNSHWSAPVVTDPITVTSAASFNIRIGCLTLTRKPNVTFYVYRTDVAGKAYYLIGTKTNSTAAESVTLSSVTWTVATYAGWPTAASGSLQGAGLYTDGGILGDVQPPAYRVTWLHQGRQFIVPVEAEESLVLYSKTEREKGGIAFNELLQLFVNPDGGAITAGASMGDRAIIFKADRIYATDGVGLNDQGQGYGYSEPLLISPNVGCISRKSVVRVPAGILFQSRTGICLLDHQLQVHHVGQPVKEHTDDGTISCAVLVPSLDAVLFCFSTAGTEGLLYHWKWDQWVTWTHSSAVDAVVVDAVPWLLSDDYDPPGADTRAVLSLGSGYEDPGSAWITRTLRTNWLHFRDLLGFKRMIDAMVLGYARSPCLLNIKVAYDLAPSWVDSFSINAAIAGRYFDHTEHFEGDGSLPAHTAFAFKALGTQTYCKAVQYEISDAPEDDGLLALWHFDDGGGSRHPVDGDCIAHWAMDGASGENEPDDSGSGLTFVETNGPVAAQSDNPFGDGTTSRDVSVDGWGTHYFAVSSGLSVFDNLAGITICAWVHFVETAHGTNFIGPIFLLRNGGANYISLSINMGGGVDSPPYRLIGEAVMSVSDADTLDTGAVITAGWHHIAMIVDGTGGTAKLYIDGVEADDDAGGCSGVTNNSAAAVLECGDGGYSTTHSLPGYMSDMAVYDVAKSEAWLTAQVAAGAPSAVDATGSHDASSVNDDRPAVTTGKLGTGAFDFSAGAAMEAASSTSAFNKQELTVAGWVRYTASATGPCPIAYKKRGSDAYSWMLDACGGSGSNRKPALKLYFDDATSLTVAATTDLSLAWHFVVGTFDGTWARLYVDGVLVAESLAGSGKTIDYNTTDSAYLGGSPDSGISSVPGYLDEVSIWDDAKPLGWVETMYAGGDGYVWPTVAGAGVDLTAMAFEIISKPGLHRLAADRGIS
jgi:hypothetical protein